MFTLLEVYERNGKQVMPLRVDGDKVWYVRPLGRVLEVKCTTFDKFYMWVSGADVEHQICEIEGGPAVFWDPAKDGS